MPTMNENIVIRIMPPTRVGVSFSEFSVFSGAFPPSENETKCTCPILPGDPISLAIFVPCNAIHDFVPVPRSTRWEPDRSMLERTSPLDAER